MLGNIIYKISFLYCCFFLINDVVGADPDKVKTVSVLEGDSVTLLTNIMNIQSRDHILWMFGPKETRIAELYKQSIDMFDSKKTFGDQRLLLDSQTGSLTIRNIRTEHTGLYKLQIRSDRGNSDKRYSVTVYAPLPVPVITRDSSQCSSSSERSSVLKCVLLCSVMNVRDVSLSWYKGNSLLSSISVSDLNIRLSLEVDYQDNNTYSCVLNNTITNQTQHLNITQLCQMCSEQIQVNRGAVIPVVVLVIVLAVVILLYRKYKRNPKKGFEPCKRAVQKDEEEVHYADTTFC